MLDAHDGVAVVAERPELRHVLPEEEVAIAEECPAIVLIERRHQEAAEGELGRERLAVELVEALPAFLEPVPAEHAGEAERADLERPDMDRHRGAARQAISAHIVSQGLALIPADKNVEHIAAHAGTFAILCHMASMKVLR